MSILVVGSVAYDDLETPSGKRDRVLGGAASHFSTSASFFSPVSLVAVVGGDFDERHISFFQKRGIDISGLQMIPEGKTFHWTGHYLNDINHAETLETRLGVFEYFRPQLTEQHRSIPFVFLANIHPELQLSVLEQVKAPKLVAMDTMNFWITSTRDQLQKVIERVDILFVNDNEAKMLTGEKNVTKAASQMMGWGPKVIVVKRGEHGALLFGQDFVFSAPGMPLAHIVDPTGAGDSFAGGFIGYLAKSQSALDEAHLRRAAICGSVMASFQVEDFSLDRMRTLTAMDIERRYRDFKSLSDFPDTAIFE
ncbi:MAG: sugar kinase [Deltaproteobacteria bacterium RIFCSPLOWO2_02_FULL_44_10]|nr:MAG: sugar kinase [Deltaproteobacteria bacterium RIFCSPHIGHO2_02_FULL_44_16]OGQ45715.1 MAG: sugar kinase [Deltaproteobacteria bacterium RIFCSPLOWO2_02_FULL_44_10]